MWFVLFCCHIVYPGKFYALTVTCLLVACLLLAKFKGRGV